MTSPAQRPGPDDPVRPVGPMTFEEFLAFDAATDLPYEYFDGYAYAKAGVRRAHNVISLNIAARLWSAARGDGPCRTFTETFGVRTPGDQLFLPDVMVACGSDASADTDYVEHPCLVVEVLSPSTEARG